MRRPEVQIGPFNVTLGNWCGGARLRLLPGFRAVQEQTASPRPALQYEGVLPRKLRIRMATFSMTDTQQVTMSVSYVDKRGNPTAPPAGAQPPAWLVDNADMLTLQPAADGMSCVVLTVGPLGTATVSVKVSDTGGNPLAAGTIDVKVVSGAPTTVSLTPGTATEQP